MDVSQPRLYKDTVTHRDTIFVVLVHRLFPVHPINFRLSRAARHRSRPGGSGWAPAGTKGRRGGGAGGEGRGDTMVRAGAVLHGALPKLLINK